MSTGRKRNDKTWNDWCWSSSSSSTPQAGTQYSWTWHNCDRHSHWSNQGSPVDTTSNDPRQYGDGRGEVIPSFDETDSRQCERRARLFASNTRVVPEKRAGQLVFTLIHVWLGARLPEFSPHCVERFFANFLLPLSLSIPQVHREGDPPHATKKKNNISPAL